MARTNLVFKVEDPHFTIRLSDDQLKIDLKGNFKNELEEALENKPVLKETIGRVLGIFVPLHIQLSDVDSVHMDETGKIKVSLSHHRDIVIPFERKEDAETLVEKLNQLISSAETKKIQASKLRSRAERKKYRSARTQNEGSKLVTLTPFDSFVIRRIHSVFAKSSFR